MFSKKEKNWFILAACLAATFLETGAFSQFQDQILKAHNELREKHHSPPLELNQELCDSAAKDAIKKAVTYSRKGKFDTAKRQHGISVIDQTWVMEAQTSFVLTAKKVLDGLAEEAELYDFDNPGFNPKSPHFTQMVWKSTEELGVGNTTLITGKGKTKKFVTVVILRYAPAGNIDDADAFADNVLRA